MFLNPLVLLFFSKYWGPNTLWPQPNYWRGHGPPGPPYRAPHASRVVNVWNSLPSFVVSAVTVNCFKSRLDKFWKNQEIIYDYHAHIQGTGNRSEVVV